MLTSTNSSSDYSSAFVYSLAEENMPTTDNSLEETARQEQEYLRGKLREELQREPTEQEADEWLRQHTEGY